MTPINGKIIILKVSIHIHNNKSSELNTMCLMTQNVVYRTFYFSLRTI